MSFIVPPFPCCRSNTRRLWGSRGGGPAAPRAGARSPRAEVAGTTASGRRQADQPRRAATTAGSARGSVWTMSVVTRLRSQAPQLRRAAGPGCRRGRRRGPARWARRPPPRPGRPAAQRRATSAQAASWPSRSIASRWKFAVADPMPPMYSARCGRRWSAASSTSAPRATGTPGADLEVRRRRQRRASGGRSPRRAARRRPSPRRGEQKIGSQPSAISAARAMFFGPSRGEVDGQVRAQRVDGGAQRLALPGAAGQGQLVERRRRSRTGRLPAQHLAHDVDVLAGAGQRARVGLAVPALDHLGARTRPRPRTNRPPLRWSRVRAAIAVAVGVRADICAIAGAQPDPRGSARPTRPAG